jgi:hypothetical protein
MKKKFTLILLFMFVFAGVALLGYTPAWGDWTRKCITEFPDPEYPGRPVDEPGECVTFKYQDNPAYVMRAWNGWEDPNNPIDPADVTIGTDWPRDDTRDGVEVSVFWYMLGHHISVNKGNKPPTPSYIGVKLRGTPIDTTPWGSLLDMSQLYKDCRTTVYSPFYVLKMNTRATWNKDYLVEIVAPRGTPIDDCGWVMMIIADECYGIHADPSLAVPQLAGVGPFQGVTNYTCPDGVTVTVTLDECGVEPPTLECTDRPGSTRELEFVLSATTARAIPFEGEAIEFQLQRVGIRQVIVCTDDLPIVFWGDQASWCVDVTP